MTLRTWWNRIAWLLLTAIIGLSLLIKHNLFPFYPQVNTTEATSGYISDVYYDVIVPEESILKVDGNTFIFVIQSNSNYWLDSHYAYRVEVQVIEHEAGRAAIRIESPTIEWNHGSQVVLQPSQGFKSIQKIKLQKNV